MYSYKEKSLFTENKFQWSDSKHNPTFLKYFAQAKFEPIFLLYLIEFFCKIDNKKQHKLALNIYY